MLTMEEQVSAIVLGVQDLQFKLAAAEGEVVAQSSRAESAEAEVDVAKGHIKKIHDLLFVAVLLRDSVPVPSTVLSVNEVA